MAKSKLLKVWFYSRMLLKLFLSVLPSQHERQSEKMEVEDLMEKVDTEWKSIHGFLPRAVS